MDPTKMPAMVYCIKWCEAIACIGADEARRLDLEKVESSPYDPDMQAFGMMREIS